MATRQTIDRLSGRIEHLLQRAGVKRELRFVFGNHGEEGSKLIAHYQQEHPNCSPADQFMLVVWRDPPRQEFCSPDSLTHVLPGARQRIEETLTTPGYGPDIYEEQRSRQAEWKRLAQQFGVDYGEDVKDERFEERARPTLTAVAP
jgi:hypothetical protein